MIVVKDTNRYELHVDRVRKSILYEKINLTQRKFVSKLSCKQTARLLFSYLLCTIKHYTNSNYTLNVTRKPRSINENGY